MIVVFIVMSILYLTLVSVMIVVWHQIPTEETPKPLQNFPMVSVIVPVRNEAQHLEKLLSQVITQSYASDRYEVIIVNDHSTDGTSSIVEELIENSEVNLRLLNLEDSIEGKKAALSKGISQATGEIIVTTDGDCQVDQGWLLAVVSCFDKEIKMVFGPVAIKPNTFFGRLQMIDFAALIGTGAATWKMGMTGMCNGANLAFRKATFQECNGYEGTEQHPSGDDEFLLRKVHERYPKGVRFVKSKTAVVFTDSQPSVSTFIQQRIRWAGKWKLHRDSGTILAAVFIFFFYTLTLIVTGRAFLTDSNIPIVISIWGVKWLLDVILVGSILKLSNQSLPIIESIILSIIYPFYAIGIGISTINYTFEWKGRQY